MPTAGDRLLVRSRDPYNAEPAPADLIAAYRTPPELFYVRSHGAVPVLPDDHAIVVDAGSGAPRRWTRDALAATFPVREVAATLQCAGNRRADFQEVAPTNGDPWGIGAIGHACWTGVALIDVLRDAGLDEHVTGHVRFTASDTVPVEDETAPYGVSIALEKARDRDVLIAWAMNGTPLAPAHGAPLRLVVPGFAGVRSIKWLAAIQVTNTPSPAPIQARDYKLFPASVRDLADADWDAGLTIEQLPVTSAIAVPADGAQLTAGPTTIRGYAIAYDRAVARVEVSADGGATWHQARLADGDGRWSWVHWSCAIELAAGPHRLTVRAVDAAGQGQPRDAAQLWNVAGYGAAAWHGIDVTVAA